MPETGSFKNIKVHIREKGSELPDRLVLGDAYNDFEDHFLYLHTYIVKIICL